jgi:hypothetical protein
VPLSLHLQVSAGNMTSSRIQGFGSVASDEAASKTVAQSVYDSVSKVTDRYERT